AGHMTAQGFDCRWGAYPGHENEPFYLVRVGFNQIGPAPDSLVVGLLGAVPTELPIVRGLQSPPGAATVAFWLNQFQYEPGQPPEGSVTVTVGSDGSTSGVLQAKVVPAQGTAPASK